MQLNELAAAGLPGVAHAIRAAPNMGWPAEGLAIWPPNAKVGIRCWRGTTQDIASAHFGCTTCGWGSQPWSEWVALAKRILAVDAANQESQG